MKEDMDQMKNSFQGEEVSSLKSCFERFSRLIHFRWSKFASSSWWWVVLYLKTTNGPKNSRPMIHWQWTLHFIWIERIRWSATVYLFSKTAMVPSHSATVGITEPWWICGWRCRRNTWDTTTVSMSHEWQNVHFKCIWQRFVHHTQVEKGSGLREMCSQ